MSDEQLQIIQEARQCADEDDPQLLTASRLSLTFYRPPRCVEIDTPHREIIIRDTSKRGAHGYGLMSKAIVARFDQESYKTVKAAAQLIGDTSISSFVRQAVLNMSIAILEDFAQEVDHDRIDFDRGE